jgi:hypothetical protein
MKEGRENKKRKGREQGGKIGRKIRRKVKKEGICYEM